MLRGAQREARGLIFAQALLVWGADKIHGPTFITDGVFFERGQPVDLQPEQRAAVERHAEACRKAGRFVMPEEVEGVLNAGAK